MQVIQMACTPPPNFVTTATTTEVGMNEHDAARLGNSVLASSMFGVGDRLALAPIRGIVGLGLGLGIIMIIVVLAVVSLLLHRPGKSLGPDPVKTSAGVR